MVKYDQKQINCPWSQSDSILYLCIYFSIDRLMLKLSGSEKDFWQWKKEKGGRGSLRINLNTYNESWSRRG